MGQLTHDQIVTEAIELAGNTGLTTRARMWLGLILRELLEKFPAPLIGVGGGIGSTPPNAPTTVTAGSTFVTVGGTSVGNTTRSVRRVWLCTNGQTDFVELQVEHFSTMDMPPRAYNGVVGVARGRPLRVICQGVEADSLSYVKLFFDPIPDKTYALWFLSDSWITAQGAYLGGSVSMYPNDLTIVQGVYAMCLKHQADERFASEWAEFRRLASEDRARWMNASNANTRMRLSPRSFRPRNSKRNPWDWMGPK